MDKLLKYKIIGIGDFSHGIQESWLFRLKILKHAMKRTNKQIIIFNEMSIWQAENIMNHTIWSIKENKFIEYDGIKIEKSVQNNSYVGGKLWQYINHAMESDIFLKIIKYIRKHSDRITIIGIDNDKIDRDYDMYKIIKNNYNATNINFIWASNHHISTMPLSDDNLKYIENKKHKWFCGYYLKKRFTDDYCIILSQAYKGTNRFNGYCSGDNCKKRTYQLDYFFSKYKYNETKKYVDNNKKYQLLTEYNVPLVTFSNSYYQDNKYGIQQYIDTNTFNYVLFWNKVHKLNKLK